jgi:RimJ/RimL family protein N-acetyltransferase
MSRQLVELTCPKAQFRPVSTNGVRWLDREADWERAQAFWPSDSPLTRLAWDEAHEMGFHCCAIIEGTAIASIAAEYRYAADTWMVAAVRTGPAYRRRGYAKATVSFVTERILSAERRVTCYTNADNTAMIRTAQSLGFELTVVGQEHDQT